MPKTIFHEREHWPRALACKACDWRVDMADLGEDWKDKADALFVEHIPEAERQIEIWVDCTVGKEGAWVMPEGRPVAMLSNHTNRGTVFFNSDCGLSLPIAKFTFADGRVVKTR